MAALTLALKAHQEAAYYATQQARITLETSIPTLVATGATAAGDSRRLRGIPCLAPGVGGAINGTRPHTDGTRYDSVRP